MAYLYRTVFSARRSLSLEIEGDGSLLVRAPYRTDREKIRQFVCEHERWINTHLPRVLERARRDAANEPTEEGIEALIRSAEKILPGRVSHYSALMGVCPSGITITGAKTRWGSCSPKNRLCFSWRLMQFPEEAVDYVVVHELSHIRHRDHSKAFYAEIARILPDYKARENLLRTRQYKTPDA